MPATYETDGGEFRVNTYTSSDQTRPVIAALDDGGYVVVWQSQFQDGSSWGVYAQAYNDDGTARGSEFRVNTYTSFEQQLPTVATLLDGGFVISWSSYGQDGDSYGVYARIYNSDGTARGAEFRVNTTTGPGGTASSQSNSAVAVLADGGFVITWESWPYPGDNSNTAVVAQAYNANGTPRGGEFRVNTRTAAFEDSPAIAGLADGGYVICWIASHGQDGSGDGIYAQAYNANGTIRGGEVRVNTTTTSDQIDPVITGLADGGYVVSWASSGQDGSEQGIYAQVFNANGTARGSEFRVNTTTIANQVQPTITALADGGYVISWASAGQDGSGYGVYAQAYHADGSLNGGEIRVNSHTSFDQQYPSVVALPGEGFMVAWASNGQDGAGYGVYVQRYGPLARPSGADAAISLAEDSSRVLTSADFGFSDPDGDTFTGIVVTTMPTDGWFALDGIWVSADQFISAANIAAGKLVFSPWASENGSGYASFTFQVRDNGASNHTDTTPNTITFNVSAVNDPPSAAIGPTGFARDGAEVTVNSVTTSDQTQPSVTALAGGGHVVTWTTWNEHGYEIHAQLFDATGAAVGGETVVNSISVDFQQQSSAAALEDGGYIIVWQSYGQDSDHWGIFAQRFDSAGVAQGGETQVNTTAAGAQFEASVAGLAGGGFAVAWVSPGDGDSYGIHAQLYDSSGDPIGSETQVNTTVAGVQQSPSVAGLTFGGFVVTWASLNAASTGWDIYAQQYLYNGDPWGTETLIHSTNGLDQPMPVVTTTGFGNYVIAWVDGGGIVKAQLIGGSDGLPFGPEILVNATPTGITDLTIATIADGGFVVSWSSQASGIGETRAWAFDTWGVPLGGEVLVSSTNGTLGGVAAAGVGEFGYLLAWTSFEPQNGADWEIHSQFFEAGIYASEQVAHSLKGRLDFVDIDAGTGILTAFLSVDHGVLHVTAGASGVTVSGSGTSDVTLNGTSSQLYTLLGAQGFGTIDYMATGDTPPAAATLTFSLSDNGNSGSGFIGIGGASATISIAAVDDAPNGADATVTVGEAGHHVFASSDFGFSDVDGDAFTGILVTSFPWNGALALNGVQLWGGEFVTVADIAAGNLIFTPDPGEHGDNYASFSFEVRDDGATNNSDPFADTITIDVAAPVATDAVRNDFNGDGRSDVLWRSESGQFSNWLANANGGFANNDTNAFASVPTSWQVTGTGDFNGDGFADVLWRSDAGQFSNWLGQANGGFTNNDANAFATVPTSWHVVGTGDFNGDGRDDALWRSDAGQVSNWLGSTSGGFTNNDANAFASVPTSWLVVGTGDFNGDGRDDILWRSTSGQLSNWLGTDSGGWVNNDANAFTSAPTDWHITGTGDFNGDGRDDILWRSDAGQLSNWLATASGGWINNDSIAFTTVPTNWQVVAVGDYNGDGFADILWRSDSGQLSNWLGTASGGFINNDANAFTSAPTDWHTQPDLSLL